MADAQDLVAKLMEEPEDSSDEEALSGSAAEGLRHLCYTDPGSVDEGALRAADGDTFERILHRAATEATATLLAALWKLPTDRTSQGPVASLPSCARGLVLPREKPLPEPKPETKWQKFAREKGIEKQKRGRMVWDDAEEKWAPRYGYQRAGGDPAAGHPIIEVKAGEDPFEDPWDRLKNEKKSRVDKNTLQRAKNEQRAGKRAPAPPPPREITAKEAAAGVASKRPGIPVELGADKAHKGKAGVGAALTLAQHSTASMGTFDVRRVGEPLQRKPGGARKQKVANDMTSSGLASEKERNAKLLGRVLASGAENPAKPSFKGSRGERIEARKRSREYHPLDDSPYENLGGGEAGDFKKKKGRAGMGKVRKVTKKRAK